MDSEDQTRFLQMLDTATEAVGVPLSEEQKMQCLNFTERLLTVNETMNLTRITTPDAIAIKHFADSLTILPALPGLKLRSSVLDVGTGAGFPGIPLKIVRPDLRLTLLDSLAKRVRFINETCTEIGLDGVQTVHSRAEDAGKNPLYRGKFDLVTARAVASLPTLLEWCSPFLAPQGRFVAMKADISDDELQDAAPVAVRLGLTLISDVALNLPTETDEGQAPRRRLLIYSGKGFNSKPARR
jgi:16S rRNA (guanine527-N7)-methyltransferase